MVWCVYATALLAGIETAEADINVCWYHCPVNVARVTGVVLDLCLLLFVDLDWKFVYNYDLISSFGLSVLLRHMYGTDVEGFGIIDNGELMIQKEKEENILVI
ncbi:hypothetical protein FCM35_KLT18013 [Carex littledalei]|uniref:Uncharacterized protein n=1 Tax=Carex littledalei TaxID=544730 RepID=A0A833RE05_9POAL|nr:hypothetical protein FCM35_KLT18013 [Carex littledalei]